MPLFSFEGKHPTVHPTAFIAPTAVLIGDVTIEDNASVWYNAVVRADVSPMVIRRGPNQQDRTTLSYHLCTTYTRNHKPARSPRAESVMYSSRHRRDHSPLP